MEEFVRAISGEAFQKELEVLKETLAERRSNGFSRYDNVQFPIGWMSSPTAKTHLPEQLGQIFDLAE